MKIPLYLRVLNSPFKLPSLKWYFGKVAIPVPYFLPRKWVKYTEKDIEEAVEKQLSNPKAIGKVSAEQLRKMYKNYTKAVPLKFGFSSCTLGWKTKFNSFRFEFAPRLSFVCFGYQLAVTFVAPHEDQYWECFLAFHYDTDKTKSWKERLEQCIKEYPCVWTQYKQGGEKTTTDYWKLVLKNKYTTI